MPRLLLKRRCCCCCPRFGHIILLLHLWRLRLLVSHRAANMRHTRRMQASCTAMRAREDTIAPQLASMAKLTCSWRFCRRLNHNNKKTPITLQSVCVNTRSSKTRDARVDTTEVFTYLLPLAVHIICAHTKTLEIYPIRDHKLTRHNHHTYTYIFSYIIHTIKMNNTHIYRATHGNPLPHHNTGGVAVTTTSRIS